MTTRILVGDALTMLRTLSSESVHCAITSPPYLGLRDYGTEPLVWGGDAEHAHTWQDVDEFHNRGDSSAGPKQKSNAGAVTGRGVVRYSTCNCGAWLGSLGLEPTPELYIEHMVEVFREVRRVLRPDATCWINMGDSYAGSGNGSNDYRQNGSLSLNANKYQGQKPGTIANLPAKNLLMMPARLAMALQADGWWLRSMIPWLKRNSMPESVTDRPATALEYVFLLSKSGATTYWTHRALPGTRTRPDPDYRWVHKVTGEEVSIDPVDPGSWRRINLWDGHDYYWDADAVRIESSRETSGNTARKVASLGERSRLNTHLGSSVPWINDGSGRSFRNSDWFFQTWQGLLLDEQDDPLALVVNPAGFSAAHFATFPVALVEPMIKAGTSEKGVCPECGAPWARMAESNTPGERVEGTRPGRVSMRDGWIPQSAIPEDRVRVTTGWRPTCAHTDAEPVPATVLDPFFGAGTTGLAADRLGRNCIGIELNEQYAAMAQSRLTGDSPMFTDVEVA